MTECKETAKGSPNTATSSLMLSGNGDEHGLVGRQVLGEATGRVFGRSGVDPGGQWAVEKVPAQAVVAVLAGATERLDAAGHAGQPRVEDHPLTHLEAGHPLTDLGDLGHHFVAQHGGEGEVPFNALSV